MLANQTNQDIIYDKILDILESAISIVKVLKSQNNQRLQSQETKVVSTEAASKDRLIPVTKWNEYYEYPAIGGLRSLIFNKDTNGFDKVIRRVGRRVLIKEDEFFKWVESNK